MRVVCNLSAFLLPSDVAFLYGFRLGGGLVRSGLRKVFCSDSALSSASASSLHSRVGWRFNLFQSGPERTVPKLGPNTHLIEGEIRGKKLYVGNLPYSVDSSELEQMFTPYGAVSSAQIITDRETGRSKGFGFVEMANDNEAQAAIDALNGQDNGGRPLTVNEAKPREDRGGGGGGGRGGFGGGGGGGRGGDRGGFRGGRDRY